MFFKHSTLIASNLSKLQSYIELNEPSGFFHPSTLITLLVTICDYVLSTITFMENILPNLLPFVGMSLLWFEGFF